MAVRMKLVVPLTMPRTRETVLTARSAASGERIGIPPATAASKRSAPPVRRAIASSSGPWWAMTCLLAVTTCLPAPRAAAMSVWAGSSPPITSTMIVDLGIGDEVGRGVRQELGRDPPTLRLRQVADRDAGKDEAGAVERGELLRAFEEGAHDGAADGAGAEHRDAEGGSGGHRQRS